MRKGCWPHYWGGEAGVGRDLGGGGGGEGRMCEEGMLAYWGGEAGVGRDLGRGGGGCEEGMLAKLLGWRGRSGAGFGEGGRGV